MTQQSSNCPDAAVHGNPFRYCPSCDWVEETVCKHCGMRVVSGPGTWYHEMGEGSLIMRCDPEKSGQPYGLNAAPA